MVTAHEQPVTFELCHSAHKALLMLRGARRSSSSLIAMGDAGGGRWRVSVLLRPGDYRFRYYVDDGRCLFYASPADFGTYEMEGFDAVLTVSHDPLPRQDAAAVSTTRRVVHSGVCPVMLVHHREGSGVAVPPTAQSSSAVLADEITDLLVAH